MAKKKAKSQKAKKSTSLWTRLAQQNPNLSWLLPMLVGAMLVNFIFQSLGS